MDVRAINRKIFTELGREKKLAQYHDIIYKLLGVVVDFINAEGESLKLSRMRHFNPYCVMLRSTNSGFAACRECDRKHAHQASVKHDIVRYRCHAGLTEMFMPFYSSSGDYIGCMTSGQFFSEDDTPMDDGAVREIARAHKLDPETMCGLYHQTKVLSPLQVEGIIEYLNTV
ncbi:MAG: PocR ligand-binding domain-containing protein, partial [Victivallaceae bacterium]|nr:PocR ligand-binding domain-containing protein [Victivallaceae bacterium]